MGIAVGRMGMSREDFERCTPLEFTRIVEKFNDWEDLRFREVWERTRMEIISVAAMFSSKPIDPRAKFPLPWDKEYQGKQAAVPKGTSSPDRMRKVLGRLKK